MDSNFYDVKLLLSGEGANGGTVFTDTCLIPKTVTAVGSITTSTAQFKFGSASLLFPGSGLQYLTIPSNSRFAFAGDYTVEMFVRWTAKTVGKPDNLFTVFVNNGLSIYWDGGLYSANRLRVSNYNIDNPIDYSFNPTIGQWYHIAVSRSGTTCRLFVDGALAASATIATSHPQGEVRIGGLLNPTPSWTLNGNIDELRVTNGFARYTAAFTAPTAAFDTTGPTPPAATLNYTLTGLGVAAYGGGTANISMAMVEAVAYGGATIQIGIPAVTVSARGGAHAALSLPMPLLRFVAHDSAGENAFDYTLGALTLEARGGANASMSLPAIEAEATATVTAMGHAAIELPAIEVHATASVSAVGRASLTLHDGFRVRAFSGAVTSIILQDGFTIESGATAGGVGSVSATLPMFELEAIATRQNSGSAELTLPMIAMVPRALAALVLPGLRLVAAGHAVVTVSYEAYAVNLAGAGNEVTRYTAFPFNQILRLQNRYYGVADNGLYLLEGETDAGSPIAWAFKTAMTDFDTFNQKQVNSVFVGGRMGNTAVFTSFHGETAAGAVEVRHDNPRGETGQTYRQRFGMGNRARYFGLQVEDDSGGALDVESLEFEVNQLKRKI